MPCVSAGEDKPVGRRFPSKAKMATENLAKPAILTASAQPFVLTSSALQMLGIKTGANRSPYSGAVTLDNHGEPTGALDGMRTDLTSDHTVAMLERYYRESVQENWNRFGFTSLVAITPAAVLPVLRQVALSGMRSTIRYTISTRISAIGRSMSDEQSMFPMYKGVDPSWFRFARRTEWIDGDNDIPTRHTREPHIRHSRTDSPGGIRTFVAPQRAAKLLPHGAGKVGMIHIFDCCSGEPTNASLNAYYSVVKSRQLETIIRIKNCRVFRLTPAQFQRVKETPRKGLHVSSRPIRLLQMIKRRALRTWVISGSTLVCCSAR